MQTQYEKDREAAFEHCKKALDSIGNYIDSAGRLEEAYAAIEEAIGSIEDQRRVDEREKASAAELAEQESAR